MINHQIALPLEGDRVHTTLLFSQHTGVAEQAFPLPTPMTLMGEQLRPRRPVTPSRTMPRRPSKRPPSTEEDYAFA